MSKQQDNQNSSKKSFIYKAAGAKYLGIVINIFFSIIMARLLSPEDYGIYAVVNVLAGYMMTTSNLGIGAAIIQKKNLVEKEIECIYSFTALIGIILGLIMVFFGIPLSQIYNNKVYYILCQLLAIAVFLYSINIVPNALLLRDGHYNQVVLRNIIVTIGSVVITLFIAACGGKYYALIGQSISTILIYYIWNVFVTKIHFGINIKAMVSGIKKIFKYSLFSFGGDTAMYFELNLDTLMIGPFLGSTALGIYDKAYKLLDYPVGNLAGILTPILHPLLKDYQEQPDIIKNIYERIEKFFSLISIFMVTVCFCCSKEIIYILFGEKWSSAILIFQIMSVSMYPKMMMATVNSVFSSLGNTKRLFISQVKRTLVIFCGVLVGIMSQRIENVAIGIVVASWINLVITYKDLCRCNLNISQYEIIKFFGCDLIYMVAVTLSMTFINYTVIFQNNIIGIFIKGIALTVLYLLYLVISKRIYIILDILPDKLKGFCDKIRRALEVCYK